jgi:polysaccharide export outer membrane protein
MCAAFLVCAGAALAQGGGNYLIGPQDVLTITVLEQTDLGGKHAVDADGTFNFPWVGRVVAGGKPLREVEEFIRTQLVAKGYLRNPTVKVSIDVSDFRSQSYSVIGEVRNPSSYPLTGQLTLLDGLARAGSPTPSAGSEVIVLRARPKAGADGRAAVAAEVDAEDREVIRIDLDDLQGGKTHQAFLLQDKDTINVPRAQNVFVTGEVKNGGQQPYQKGMNVLQAISIAGGLTDRGTNSRVFVKRQGESKEIRVKEDERVLPGDTIIAKERVF